MADNKLPEVTRKRMLQLLQLLKAWDSKKITSADISGLTGWKASLIRHDFWLLGIKNGVSNGYFVSDLITFINRKLGTESQTIDNGEIKTVKKNCCIVGLARLGAALLDENLVEGSPFIIKTGFDSNVNRVEILRSKYPLHPANEMQYVIKSEKIEYAVLTVQDKDAQIMTDRLVNAGIKGIVNMTNVVLKVPEGVKVENVSILNALKLVL